MANCFLDVWQELLGLVQHAQRDPDVAGLESLDALLGRLKSLPPQPQSVWEKVVQDMQVPRQLGVAICSAVHVWRQLPAPSETGGVPCRQLAAGPALLSAASTLEAMLQQAAAAGLIQDSTAAGPLGVSMQQQLQQAGVLPQLTQLMAALAAELRAQAAALGSKSSEALCSGPDTWFEWEFLQQLVQLVSSLLLRLQALWGCSTRTAADNSTAWLGDASGHAEAALQLCMAVLRHSSSVLRLVLPAVRQRAPQLADELESSQAAAVASVVSLTIDMLCALSDWQSFDAEGASRRAEQEARMLQQLRQLLLSPHCLPCCASLLVVIAAFTRQDCRSLPQTDSGSQGQPGSTAGSRSRTGTASSSSGMPGATPTPTPCQLKLFELLGLAPPLTTAVERWLARGAARAALPWSFQLPGVVYVVRCCMYAASQAPAWLEVVLHSEAHQQQWRLEQQLLGLLPSLLVPCASRHMLLAAASQDPQQQCWQRINSLSLMELTHSVLQAQYQLSGMDGRWQACEPPHPGWMQEVLGGVLQLADQMLMQERLDPQHVQQTADAGTSQQDGSLIAAAASAAAAVAASRGSSWSDPVDSVVGPTQPIAEAVNLLGALVATDLMWVANSSSTAQPHSTARTQLGGSSGSSSGRGEASASAPASAEAAAAASACMPSSVQQLGAVSERLVEVCATVEACMRKLTAAVQARPVGAVSTDLMTTKCLQWLFLGRASAGANSRPELVQQLGLAGPGALPAELRQLYSLVSTVQKLGQCQSAVEPGKLCWGQEAADACCWAAGQTAACLLQVARPERAGSGAAQAAPPLFQAAAAAVMQQPESSFLPSLVIFGRCCLVWADRLQQQASQLLLLLPARKAFGARGRRQGQQPPQQQQWQSAVQAELSAAWVCIPGVDKHEGAATAASTGPLACPCELEWMVTAVSAWVGGVTTPAAQAALAAAAGSCSGSPPSFDQFRQQLQALAAVQQEVRQGLNAASLSALVQQLRATGAMLSSIAVPHFCNNASCTNISGPTDVGLVSGRSCLCAGCRTARFCSRACQSAAWRQHKRVCKALAAVAAASVVPPPAAAAAEVL